MCLDNPLNKEEFKKTLASLPDEIEVVKLVFNTNWVWRGICESHFVYKDGLNTALGFNMWPDSAGFYSYLQIGCEIKELDWVYDTILTCKIKKEWILEIGRDVLHNTLIVRTSHIEVPKYPFTSFRKEEMRIISKNIIRIIRPFYLKIKNIFSFIREVI